MKIGNLSIIPLFYLGVCSLLVRTVVCEDANALQNIRNNSGVIPDEETARQVSYLILSKIYGKDKIDRELPLKVELEKDVWHVEGTFNETKQTRGGTALIEVSRLDGTVLRIIHGK